MVPLYTKHGDLVCIIAGCPTLLVLQRKGALYNEQADQQFQLTRIAYLEGIMDVRAPE